MGDSGTGAAGGERRGPSCTSALALTSLVAYFSAAVQRLGGLHDVWLAGRPARWRFHVKPAEASRLFTGLVQLLLQNPLFVRPGAALALEISLGRFTPRYSPSFLSPAGLTFQLPVSQKINAPLTLRSPVLALSVQDDVDPPSPIITGDEDVFALTSERHCRSHSNDRPLALSLLIRVALFLLFKAGESSFPAALIFFVRFW